MNKREATQLLRDGDFKDGFKELCVLEKYNYFGISGRHFNHRDRQSNDPVLIINIDQQGWGEQLMYASIIQDFINKNNLDSNNIIWLGDSRIHSLITDSLKVRAIDGIEDIGKYPFYWITVLEIASQCRKNFNDFTNNKKPYISVEASNKVKELKTTGKRLIGLNWASYTNDSGKANTEKSIPVESFKVLASIPDVYWVSVQYTKIDMDLTEYKRDIDNIKNIFDDNFSCPDLQSNGDQREFAAFLEGLDGLISCSNSTAHLAGAIGIPTFLIFQDRGTKQWHWHLRNAKGDSLWYPQTKVHIMCKSQSNAHLDLAMEDAIKWVEQITLNS